jgi:hypothetical protein
MADVDFHVRHEFPVPPDRLWDEMIDWQRHERWIPMTRVDVTSDDASTVGGEFTAYTGIGRVALPDSMRVTELDWDDATRSGRCTVDKLGPILFGTAGFTVEPTTTGSAIDWFERVDVKYLPGFLGPVATKVGSVGFRQGMKRLAGVLRDD